MGARGKPYTRPKDTSYIRVALKDDTLGLGAKSGVNLPPTGLDAFQGLLGRLNGKQEDELEKEQRTRDDLRRAVYTENKWGALRFVSGGFLVGDKIEEAVEDIPGTEISIPTEKEAPANPHAPQPDLEPLITATDTDAKNMSKKSKKPKKSRKSGVRDLLGNQRIGDERTTCDSDPISPEREAREAMEAHVENTDTSKEETGKRAERAQRKLDRRVRREQRRLRRLGKVDSNTKASRTQDSARQFVTVDAVQPRAPPKIQNSGRPNVRSRYVQQKKMALMDPKALNEV